MLNDLLRDELKEWLYDNLVGCMFGDGMEREYIMGGMSFEGLDNMSDERLIEEYEGLCSSENDEFLKRLKVEVESHKLLSK